ncbi:MAG: hypothetical protein LBP32_04825, partial [Spirochaetaceae bacterium]|nr:hypothetical protein [Spirochaetaceae bacterium]
MGDNLPRTAPLIGALFLSLVLAGCDLFINKPEIDLEEALNTTISYANAARLTVEVYYPENWGRSPQFGPLNPDSARQGFPFTVEFSVSAAYGFAGWRAYRTSTLGNKSQAALAAAPLLTEAEAAISAAADGRASVTINITEAVTLIPWCEDRPQIPQSNPPLINSGSSYWRGQQIKIWFAGPLDPATVKFGEGFIEIIGQTMGASSEPYDDSSTPIKENGDMTGRVEGSSRFFKAPEYDAESKTITIKPGDDGEDGTKLPPGNIVITVTVGTNVLSPNGNGMAGPVVFYYQTDTRVIKNVYTAENIWAIHSTDNPSAEKFFYTSADPNRDRRLRKNASGKYEVTLYFTVQVSNPEMIDPPNKFKIAEMDYADLRGYPRTPHTEERDCTAAAPETEEKTAGAIYRQNNAGAAWYYKFTYEWPEAPEPGITRLIVLPYRDTETAGDYTDEGDVPPDPWENAHAEGHFATVVLDDRPPSGNVGISAVQFASQTTSMGGLPQYNYGRDKSVLDFTVDFSAVADNGNEGIPVMTATMDKPWTMDNAGALEWQYQITDTGGTAYPPSANLNAVRPQGDAAWKLLSANTVTDLDLSSVIKSTTLVRDLKLRYRDSLGNTSGWFTIARISYYEDNLKAVEEWSASYDPVENVIWVSWTDPTTDFEGTEAFYTVEGGNPIELRVEYPEELQGKARTVISGVPRLNSGDVRNGIPVTGNRRYDITIRAHSKTNQADTSLKIWNFGTPGISNSGISVRSSYPAEEISTQADLAAMETGDIGKKYVLAGNITLSGAWTPIGTEADPFGATFYGNGHTLSAGTGFSFSDSEHTGIFGYTGEGAVIRDLAVAYHVDAAAKSSAVNIGGMVGYAGGSTTIRNCIVSGAGGVSLSKTAASADTSIGGMAGYMEPGALIVNGFSNLNVHLGIGAKEGRAGGAVGYIAGNSVASISNIEGLSVSGYVSLDKTSNYRLTLGGVVGASESSGLIEYVSFAGTVSATSDDTSRADVPAET